LRFIATGQVSGNVTLAGATTIQVASTFIGTISGVVSGANNLTKADAGTLALSGTNTYSGTTTITAGTITVNGSGSLGAGSYEEMITLCASTQLTYASSADQVFSGTITGAGALAKTTSLTSTLTLSGTASDYTGTTTVSSGVVVVTTSAALGGSNSSERTIVESGGAVHLNGSNLVLGEPFTVQGTGVSSSGALVNLANSNTVGGTVTLANDTTIGSDDGTLTFDVAAGSSFAASGTPALSFVGDGNTTVNDPIATPISAVSKSGAGILTFAATNTYTGETTVSDGVLRAEAANALGDTTAGTTIATGARLELSSATGITIEESVISIAGTGSGSGAIRSVLGANTVTSPVTLTAASTVASASGASLTFNVLSGSAFSGSFALTFDGVGDFVVSDPIATGTGAVSKTGAGVLDLVAANTYAGATTISEGHVIIRTATGLGTTDSGTSVVSDATLTISSATALSIGEAIALSGDGITESTVQVGALRTTTGSHTITGSVTLDADAEIQVDASTGLTVSGTTNAISATNKSLVIDVAGSFEATSPIALGTGSLTKTAGGTATLSASNTYSGATDVNGGTLLLIGAGQLSNQTEVTVASGATWNLNNISDTVASIAGAGSIALGSATLTSGTTTNTTFSGVISGTSGAGTMIKQGSGSLTLSGANTYEGDTTVSAGKLIAANNAALGVNTSTGTSITSGAVLELRGGISVNEFITINGTGLSNTGALLNGVGNNTVERILSIGTTGTYIGSDAGTLTLSGHAVTGTDVDLRFLGAGDHVVSSSIATGTGTLTKAGTGKLTLSGSSSYTGATTVSQGTLEIGKNDALSNQTAVSVADGAYLYL
jgi:autotransporter-associated beta strand protein